MRVGGAIHTPAPPCITLGKLISARIMLKGISFPIIDAAYQRPSRRFFFTRIQPSPVNTIRNEPRGKKKVFSMELFFGIDTMLQCKLEGI
jgi:hypothetical protein